MLSGFLKKLLFFLLFLLIVFGSFELGLSFGQKSTTRLPSLGNQASPTSLNLDLFWQVLQNLQDKYFDQKKLKEKDLLYGAIRGMVQSLGDPYTSFFDPSQNKGFQDELAGFYEGIGAQLGFKDLADTNIQPSSSFGTMHLVVVAPLAQSPAEKAGLRAEDLILQIDNRSTQGMSLTEAVSLIRGKEGTTVKLSLARIQEGKTQAETFERTIQREKIKVDSLTFSWEGKNGKVAYIKISRFGNDTITLWKEAVKKITQECPDPNACSLIVDVRNNPGGFLEAASSLASDFFSNGVVVIREFPNGEKKESRVEEVGSLTAIPVEVLINGGSASAAEILAGAIQDRGRGKLMGEKSFGKGTVQEAVELDEGSALHVTSSKWLLPSGRWINEEGLKPDIEVKMSEEDFNLSRDPQLDKAIELVDK